MTSYIIKEDSIPLGQICDFLNPFSIGTACFDVLDEDFVAWVDGFSVFGGSRHGPGFGVYYEWADAPEAKVRACHIVSSKQLTDHCPGLA